MSPILVQVADIPRRMKDFFNLPYQLHQHVPHWVPPLKMSVKHVLNPKNPFFKDARIQYWVAYQEHKIVGRLAGIINDRHNQYYNERVAFWGFFESIESYEVTRSLFSAFEAWALSNKMDRLVGPMNPSINYECGLQISAFDTSPFVMMTQNPEYYPGLIEHQGYAKCKDLEAWCYHPQSMEVDLQKRLLLEKFKNKYQVHIRTLNMKKFNEEIQLIQRIYDDAWQDNWGYLPLNPEEFVYLAKELKNIIFPNFVYIAEIKGEACGFSVALPDMNQILINNRKGRLTPWQLIQMIWKTKVHVSIDQGRIALLGVLKKYQHLPIGGMMYEAHLNNKWLKKIKKAEFSWVLEDNEAMKQSLAFMGAQFYKSYRIYAKDVDASMV